MSKAKKQKNANKHRALSAQQTIPYIAMHPDGICQLPGGIYTKTLEYEDINYAVASTEDQTAIISGWSACLNYFDSSLPFQLSFVNRRSRNANRYKVNIPAQEDDFNSIRGEYVEMLKGQIAKSNNGIERYKYITFGLPAEGATEARPRLGRVEADVMGNLKRLGVQSHPLDGRDRLAVLHGQMHPGGREPFRFAWKDIPKTGMGTKDYIAPDSFDFRQSRTFRVGQMWGAASYLQIMASELSDKLLAEILELDAELTVTMHIQTVDQLKAIKTIKGKISDIGRMKAEEQKKAVRAGYDMEILPPDLITFSKDAAELLSDLQSRNERMFLLTFTVVNLAPTRQRLENDVFTVSGIALKYNCALRRLDWQQEQGFVSSLALGYNGIEIQRGMTTSSTAIFIPFMTRELRMDGQALYYGMNALSNNVIMADRKKLKSANGMYLGSTGSGKSFAAKRELINVFLATNDRIIVVDPMGEYAPLVRRLGGQVIEIAPDSPHHISPMDLQMNINDEDSPLSMKADFLLSLCELIVGGKEGLQPIEKTVIDRCVRLVYREMALGLETGTESAFSRITDSVLLTTWINLCILPGFVLGLLLVNRWYHVRTQTWGFILCAAGMGILLAAYEFHWPVWIAVSGFMLFELFLNAGPHLMTFIIPPQIYSVAERGAGAGLAAAFGKLGAVAGVVVIPILLKWGGASLVLWVTIGGLLAGALVTAVVGREVLPDKGRSVRPEIRRD